MLSRNETVIWRRLERLEAKVQALEDYIAQIDTHDHFKETKHYGGWNR